MEIYEIPEAYVKVMANENDTITVLNHGNVVFDYKGKYEFKILDDRTFAIIKREHNEFNFSILNLFYVNDENKLSSAKYIMNYSDKLFDKDLLNKKMMIVTSKHGEYIVNFNLNIVGSSFFYDKITYDKEEDLFYVEEYAMTDHGIVTLFGTLSSTGVLLDNSLYCPYLKINFIVDPSNVFNSCMSIKKEIHKILENIDKKKKKDEILNYECEAYLTRKKR